MLWIGLHLPQLSLESFGSILPAPAPGAPPRALAIQAAHRIVSANGCAQALGVRPGLKRATALALAPGLVLGHADAQRDAQALAGVAHSALGFTPAVSLALPQGVLLEVQASLRFFGGHAALLARLMASLQPLGHRIACASAPTAEGARVLSQWQDGLHCPDLPGLRQALARAPLTLLPSAQEHAAALQGMGLQVIGDLRRLPRTGLARRVGEPLLNDLDRAWGDCPDPREALVPAAAFDSTIELFERADTSDQLLQGAQVLLQRLVAWLSARQAFVRRFALVMKHEPRWRREGQVPGASHLDVALAEPSRDAEHLQVLLRERLAWLPLPAPTLELSLQAHDVVHQPPPHAELFPKPSNEREGLTRLIERLQARLGNDQVQRWRRWPDHRPEHSFRCEAAELGATGGTTQRRRDLPLKLSGDSSSLNEAISWPVWLFPQAQALPEHRSQPILDGRPLQLVSGPERIETGWWDTALAERDYFIARTPEGALVWLYRTRPTVGAGGSLQDDPGGWFLQGRFG